jgi:hypothetical protein
LRPSARLRIYKSVAKSTGDRMEATLSFLERLLGISIGIFALYQCFQIRDTGRLARPAIGWTVRVCLIALAAACFFTVARLAATG